MIYSKILKQDIVTWVKTHSQLITPFTKVSIGTKVRVKGYSGIGVVMKINNENSVEVSIPNNYYLFVKLNDLELV